MRKVNAKKKQRKETERSQDISDSVADENEYQEDSKNGGSDGNSVDVAREKKGKKGNRERAQNESSAKEKENIEEVEEYEVEDVVDHKIDNGVSYFLIKWKGYDSENNTWEPEETLSCPDLVSKYKKRAKAQKPTREAVPKKKLKVSNDDQANSDPNQEWEVEKIIDVEYDRNGARLFRIRWKGYRPSSDTWEPEEHLNCGDLIDKFLKKHNKKGDPSQKELREAPRQTKRFVTGTFGRRSSKRNSGRISYEKTNHYMIDACRICTLKLWGDNIMVRGCMMGKQLDESRRLSRSTYCKQACCRVLTCSGSMKLRKQDIEPKYCVTVTIVKDIPLLKRDILIME